MYRLSKYALGALISMPVLLSAAWADCDDLKNIKLSDTTITLAEEITAGAFSAPDSNTYESPAFCRVQGVAKPTPESHIEFEVWLPSENWNGRYRQVGNGGFSGQIIYGALADALREGNAVAGTDNGHKGAPPSPGLDGTWALDQPEKVIDYGYRALKVTTIAAKAVIKAYYGKAPGYSYFAGCSTGGRQAMMVAQRYPEDWDGILVGAPANYLTFTEIVKVWNERAQWSETESFIPAAKMPAVYKAALAACTTEAHVIDGVAANPRFCRYNTAKLICNGEETNECLTKEQASTLQKIYDGPIDPNTNKILFAGFEPTFENQERWSRQIFSQKRAEGPQYSLGAGFFKYFVFDDPDLDIYGMDWSTALKKLASKRISGQTLGQIVNAIDPDLRPLREKGAKLLMYYGWGDQFLPPQGAIDYYKRVEGVMGGLETTQDFFRLFMVPGMLHCAGGPGANSFGQSNAYAPALKDDADHHVMRALEKWVEEGTAPDKIIAAKYVDENYEDGFDPQEGVAITRPLCPYPKVPVYRGKGSKDLAENFECIQGKAPSSSDK